MEFPPLITRVFASFFPVTHHFPPNLKMISKNKMCILVWSHFVFHQRTGHPWKRGGTEAGGREAAGFALLRERGSCYHRHLHFSEKGITPIRAGESFCYSQWLVRKKLSPICLLPARILFQYIIQFFIPSASPLPVFHKMYIYQYI